MQRWSSVSLMAVLSGLCSVPRAQAVPISQREQPPPPPKEEKEEATPPTRPPPTPVAGPGQRVDSDAPPVPRRPRDPDAPSTNTHVGMGYKVGNRLGFFGLD